MKSDGLEDIDDNRFVNEILVWDLKGHKALEKIRIFDSANQGKIVAILSYSDLETWLFINKVYKNNQTAFQKLGALFDKAEKKK